SPFLSETQPLGAVAAKTPNTTPMKRTVFMMGGPIAMACILASSFGVPRLCQPWRSALPPMRPHGVQPWHTCARILARHYFLAYLPQLAYATPSCADPKRGRKGGGMLTMLGTNPPTCGFVPMLTMLGSNRRTCEGWTRRETLQAGALALL